jgi:hypothetical protein
VSGNSTGIKTEVGRRVFSGICYVSTWAGRGGAWWAGTPGIKMAHVVQVPLQIVCGNNGRSNLKISEPVYDTSGDRTGPSGVHSIKKRLHYCETSGASYNTFSVLTLLDR